MLCLKGHDIKLADQVEDWDKNYGSDASGLMMVLMLDCDECGEQVAILGIDPTGEFEDVETPTGETVKVPKMPFPLCSCEQGILPCPTHGWMPQV